GGAFAVHSSLSSDSETLLSRLLWNGKDVTTELPSTPVGEIGGFFDMQSVIRTDAASGITWSAFSGGGGVLVNAHYRGGEPLPGIVEGQLVLVEPQNPTPSTWGFGGTYPY